MADLSNLEVKAVDWRSQLKKNTIRTRWVIASFVAIYIMLGILVDVLLYSALYPGAPLLAIARALITLQITPFGTLTMGAVAIISLWVTYRFHNRIVLMGTQYHEVTVHSTELAEKQLYNVVEEMKVAAGLKYMPRVFIIEAEYMNAFASGFSEKSAMVAITRGLMNKLNRNELQAVMAHELSHIRHQDIKLTLTASVLSSIMLIVIDMLFYAVIFNRRQRSDGRVLIVVMIIRYVLPIVTALLMLYLSRTREYMADAGCVELMRDNQPLATALLKIHQDHQHNKEHYHQAYGQTAHEDVRRAAYLYDPVSMGIDSARSFNGLFSTHPGLEQRLQAIGVKSNTTV